ncbi:MAG: type II toxin-antitoxin system RelE/ParE family toxin [Proteobacteria bacterium]|nr:type II toxin-antitoxin system RelE/ParE family toxin [Pseudomonadota bacterium]
MNWTVCPTLDAQRQLEALDRPVRDRVIKALARLACDPYASPNVKALRGKKGRYRLRVGDWRVLYTLDRDVLVVLVVEVAHRREAYR